VCVCVVVSVCVAEGVICGDGGNHACHVFLIILRLR